MLINLWKNVIKFKFGSGVPWHVENAEEATYALRSFHQLSAAAAGWVWTVDVPASIVVAVAPAVAVCCRHKKLYCLI